MKHVLILIFLIFFNIAFSQKYQPLVEEGKYWIYNHHYTSDCFLAWQVSTEIRYFESDTIINSKQYKKLVSSFVPIDKFPLEISSKKTLCFMREDTIERKIFLINNDENVFPCAFGNEVCIWDFSLKIGDTINNCTYDILYPIDIEQNTHNVIDSIVDEDRGWGFVQKHFYTIGFSPGQCNDPWIYKVSYVEGFGMEDGPILKRYGTFFIRYCEGTLSDCNIISTINDTPLNKNIKLSIYPNPASDIFNIESTSDIIRIEIIDHNGISVYTSFTKKIDVSHLNSGMYIIKCISLEREMYYSKLIKL